MGTFLFVAGKKILGYVAGRLLKPETAVELFLDLGDRVAERTDTKGDDKLMADLREALGHEEK